MADNVTPIRPPALEASFIRGIRSCVAMLEGTRDADEFYLQATYRYGAPQSNVVRQALEEILRRGDDIELTGFCAALTEVIAISDNSGDYSRIFGEYADRRERILRRRYRGGQRGT